MTLFDSDLFISKRCRISPESNWYYFQLATLRYSETLKIDGQKDLYIYAADKVSHLHSEPIYENENLLLYNSLSIKGSFHRKNIN